MEKVNKLEFTEELRFELRGFSPHATEKIVKNYRTIIDGQMNEGRSEERSVKALGELNLIAHNAKLDMTPLIQLLMPRKKDGSIKMLTATLYSPFILIIYCFILSIYCLIWSTIIAAFILNNLLILGGLGSMIIALFHVDTSIIQSIMLFFSGLVSLTLSIFLFSPMKIGSVSSIRLLKRCMRLMKSKLI